MTLLLVSLVLCIIVGVPICYSLGISGALYFLFVHPELLSILPERLFSGMDSILLLSLPLFILMGLFMNDGSITKRLIDFLLVFVGRMRGGLGVVNVVASMIFGGISGSSVSDTASVGAILIPAMKNQGYTAEFSCGITVASSTMGMIIPPSIPMLIYAFVASQSVGKLFIGGVIPGVFIGLFMITITIALSVINKYPREEVALTAKLIWERTKTSILAILMPIFVVGVIVLGIATPTEAAGIGAFYAFIVGFFIHKELKIKMLPGIFKDAILMSASIMIIIAMSKLYIWILAIEYIPQQMLAFLTSLQVPYWCTILLFDCIILFVGTFLDVSPAIMLITPVFLPAMMALGMDPIQFGTIMITGLAIGLVTPPVGMCLNVASSISNMSIISIFRSAIPFLLANLLTLILVSFVPAISLWLPGIID
jgi:TRAP-type transport system large permease protein